MLEDVNKQIKILIVDDFSTMRRILKNILRQWGFSHFIEAENGIEALTCLREENIDIVLTDWKIPKMTGMELEEAIRSDPDLKHIPVVMMSKMNRDHGDKPIFKGFDRKRFEELLESYLNPDQTKSLNEAIFGLNGKTNI